MLKRLTLQEQLFTVGKDLIPALPLASAVRTVRRVVDMILKAKCNISFILFNDEQMPHFFKKVSCKLICDTPHKPATVFGVSKVSTIDIEVATKSGVQGFNGRSVAHSDTNANVIASVLTSDLLENVNVPFTIKETSNVAQVHNLTSDSSRMLANSEKTRCPTQLSAEGQPRAKQEANLPLGVCNEHVPTPEGKMCSELYRNVERLAEMISPFLMYLRLIGMSRKVTDCNTKYIHWRPHARRNMVPLDPDRFSVNQDAMVRLIGWAGNMTISNSFLQGTLIA